MLRQTFGCEPRREIPAAFTGLAVFVVAQRIGQGVGNLFRRGRREVGRVEGRGRIIGHGASYAQTLRTKQEHKLMCRLLERRQIAGQAAKQREES
jgi:hypothetical protein